MVFVIIDKYERKIILEDFICCVGVIIIESVKKRKIVGWDKIDIFYWVYFD